MVFTGFLLRDLYELLIDPVKGVVKIAKALALALCRVFDREIVMNNGLQKIRSVFVAAVDKVKELQHHKNNKEPDKEQPDVVELDKAEIEDAKEPCGDEQEPDDDQKPEIPKAHIFPFCDTWHPGSGRAPVLHC